MVKLNRTTEYGLIALRYMSEKESHGDSSVTSARELSDRYGLPFEITAKTLQRMRDTGLILSAQGARGGYTIGRPPSQLNVAEFLELMEGPQAVVSCAGPSTNSASSCEYKTKCEMKAVMGDLNDRVKEFLAGILLTDLAEFKNFKTLILKSSQESEVRAL